MADVVAELQAEIEAVKAEHMRQIAEKESEIVQLKNDIDAAEIRGARAILADFKSFFGLS